MKSKSKIAETFIVSYFRLLFSDPTDIGKFFAKDAEIVRVKEGNKETFLYNDQISFEKILPYKPETTIAKIYNYNHIVMPDSEEIVITVYGEIIIGLKSFNFSHTFVLIPEESKWYISSDVFSQYNFPDNQLIGAEKDLQPLSNRSAFCLRFNQNRNQHKEGSLPINTRIKPFFNST